MIGKVDPWHSEKSPVYHNHSECNTGNNIERENRRSGTGGKTRCQECTSLIVDYENARFKIAAFSKSNAQLTRFKIHVPQYIIGHSFDTWFARAMVYAIMYAIMYALESAYIKCVCFSGPLQI